MTDTSVTSTLGDRIRESLERRGISQSELARMVGVKQQTISYICSPTKPATSSKYAPQIAALLGVNPHWLQTGEGNPRDAAVPIASSSGAHIMQPVPVLALNEVVDYVRGRGVEPIATLMTNLIIGEGTFAMRVEDDSMVPHLGVGDLLIFDPTVKIQPGDYVAACFGDDVMVRKYRARSDGFDLFPINQDWPTLSCSAESDNIRPLGVMVEHRKFRSH